MPKNTTQPMRTSDPSDADRVQRRGIDSLSAGVWLSGGLIWLAAGLVHTADDWRFTTAALLWMAADLLILIGLLTFRRLRPHGTSAIGATALWVAIAARVAFFAGEALSIVQGDDENLLIPAGAVLTGLSLVVYGCVVVRQRHWTGLGRWAPLVMGLYPFAVMFPVVAATGEPSILLVAAWGIPTALMAWPAWVGAFPRPGSKASVMRRAQSAQTEVTR